MQKSKKERTFKANIIIFTNSFDLNKKWLTKEPEMVICVTGQFNVLALEFNKAFEKDIVYVDEDLEEVQKSVWNDKHKKMPALQAANGLNHSADEDEVQASVLGNMGALTFQQPNTEKLKLDDFQITRIVGQGAFGKVYKIVNKKTKKMHAMKCIRKDRALENNSVNNLLLEKEILFSEKHPFLVSMDYVFQNEHRIFFVMDFIEGGELFRHLCTVRKFSEEQGKFMIAQVAIALQHLHDKNIIYRDLKPENVLVETDGYLKLTDFGLAKKAKRKDINKTFCGTASYLAPEILTHQGHDFSVDIWCLGTLLFEMIVGIPPFYNKN